jgi:hypothetical protein
MSNLGKVELSYSPKFRATVGLPLLARSLLSQAVAVAGSARKDQLAAGCDLQEPVVGQVLGVVHDSDGHLFRPGRDLAPDVERVLASDLPDTMRRCHRRREYG